MLQLTRREECTDMLKRDRGSCDGPPKRLMESIQLTVYWARHGKRRQGHVRPRRARLRCVTRLCAAYLQAAFYRDKTWLSLGQPHMGGEERTGAVLSQHWAGWRCCPGSLKWVWTACILSAFPSLSSFPPIFLPLQLLLADSGGIP